MCLPFLSAKTFILEINFFKEMYCTFFVYAISFEKLLRFDPTILDAPPSVDRSTLYRQKKSRGKKQIQ